MPFMKEYPIIYLGGIDMENIITNQEMENMRNEINEIYLLAVRLDRIMDNSDNRRMIVMDIKEKTDKIAAAISERISNW